MLILDNCEGEVPEVTSCFTSRLSRQDLAVFYRAREDVVRALRRNGFPEARYVMRLHFTPGWGTHSGGKRRPHWHGMWKGIARERVEEAAAIAVPTWCAALNRAASKKAGRPVVVALPQAQYFAAIENADAMLRYVTTHFGKTDQLPPSTFRGHQFTASRDYFNGATAKVVRARARESRARAQITRRVEAAGIGGHDLVLAVELEMHERAQSRWVLANERGARLTEHAPAAEPAHWRLFAELRGALAYVDACDVKTRAVYRLLAVELERPSQPPRPSKAPT